MMLKTSATISAIPSTSKARAFKRQMTPQAIACGVFCYGYDTDEVRRAPVNGMTTAEGRAGEILRTVRADSAAAAAPISIAPAPMVA